MSKRQVNQKNKGSKAAVIIPTLLLVGVFAAGGGIWYSQSVKTSVTDSVTADSYKTTQVQRGSVGVNISESGTVTTGTQTQIFSLSDADTYTAAISGTASEEISDAAEDVSDGTDAAEATSAVEIHDAVEITEEAKTMSADDMSAMPGSGSNAAGGSTGGSASSGGNSTGTSSDSTQISTALEVESVLVSVGQAVEIGDAILTITQESIDAYRAELETAVSSAQLAVTQEEINVESKRAEAEYTYSMYLAKGETAQETYDATIASLASAVEDAQEAVDEAQEDVDTYQGYVDSGYDYEDELEEAQEALEEAQDALTIAQNNQTTQSIEARQTLESALTNYEYADQLYQIDTDGLEDDLDDAKKALADAEQALADFDSCLQDGTIYAQYSGTVMSIAYEAGDELTDDSELIVYSDSENVTMTVSVTQEDISNISIGDEAEVSLDAYDDETFSAVVTAIETAASMGSSTVTYNVTVTFTEDVSKIYNGMTGEAAFNIQSEDDVLYVSNRAVNQDGTSTYVKVLNEDGTISSQTVTTGFSNGKNVVILSGLDEGENVIIESGLTT